MRALTVTMDWREASQRQETTYVGMIIGLASWLMLFASLLLAYAVLRAQQPQWPPPGTAPLPTALAAANTAVLAASSLTMALASRRAARRAAGPAARWSWITLALGTAFLGLQAWLWWQTLNSGIVPGGLFGSVFYALTVLHALHVLGGLAAVGWLAVRCGRLRGLRTDAARQLPAQPVAMYWHFVDVVWIALFVAIFLI